VDAHVAALKEVGLTDPGQTASFCTTSIPWLRATCKSVMLPVIEFCSAGGPLPPRLGNAHFELAEARKRIWASLSDAANRGQIDPALVTVDQPAVAAATPVTLQSPGNHQGVLR